MSVNLEGLSSKELAELISRANQRKKVLAKRKPANQVKAAVAKFLKSTGWSFDELYGRPGAANSQVLAIPDAIESLRATGTLAGIGLVLKIRTGTHKYHGATSRMEQITRGHGNGLFRAIGRGLKQRPASEGDSP